VLGCTLLLHLEEYNFLLLRLCRSTSRVKILFRSRVLKRCIDFSKPFSSIVENFVLLNLQCASFEDMEIVFISASIGIPRT
jgi:hypothetical protein